MYYKEVDGIDENGKPCKFKIEIPTPYIRTKDKIYGFIKGVTSSVQYDEEEDVYSIYYFDEEKGAHLERDGLGGRSMDSVWRDDIVSEADTIEELCDEFLLENKKTHWKGYMPYHKSTIHDEALQRDYIIYGAIWTDKGLIYAAKMNDKGDLELL